MKAKLMWNMERSGKTKNMRVVLGGKVGEIGQYKINSFVVNYLRVSFCIYTFHTSPLPVFHKLVPELLEVWEPLDVL